MTFADYLLLTAFFLVTSFGLGLPLARRLTGDPLEILCAAPVIGLALSFVITFLLFANYLPMKWFAVMPLIGGASLLAERKSIHAWWTDLDARQALLGWVVVAAWTQALAMIVVSYGGGAWAGDWLEHHQRAIFFREHVGLRFMFMGDYLLPARPPLVNVVTAAYQAISIPAYACDQVVIGLWSSFVFLPLALFFRRAGGTGAALAVLTALLLVNPAFLQNSTFAWTKLPTAFFVLAGAHFLLRSLEAAKSTGYFALATAALTTALLAHYSAGPFCAVLVVWWLLWRTQKGGLSQITREIATGLAIAVPLLALWFGWAFAAYGVNDTLLSNSTALEAGPPDAWAQLVKIFSNIFNTLVPHPFRTVDYSLIHNASPLSWFRDYFFMIVQVNVFALMGSGGFFALVIALWRGRMRAWPSGSPLGPRWVVTGIFFCIVLGVAVHGAADEWGLAHICLQPLGLLGLAVLAAKFKDLGRAGLTILIIGVTWDAAVNVGLHYWLQTQPARPEWLGMNNLVGTYKLYGAAAFNACLKDVTHVRFLSDTLPVRGLVVPLVVMVGAALAWRRSNRAPTPSSPIS